jgi:outer membrane receptor protein involved in Fe transport
LLAHPVYNKSGEIPSGGRGKLGRTPTFWRFDFHADYPWKLNEHSSIKFVADFFNIFNRQTLRLPDQNRQVSVGFNNVDFLQPAIGTAGYYPPFNLRLGVRFEF